jgi:hypothetical protein
LLSLHFRSRLPQHQWWLTLRPLLRILAKHAATYETEGTLLRGVDGPAAAPGAMETDSGVVQV